MGINYVAIREAPAFGFVSVLILEVNWDVCVHVCEQTLWGGVHFHEVHISAEW